VNSCLVCTGTATGGCIGCTACGSTCINGCFQTCLNTCMAVCVEVNNSGNKDNSSIFDICKRTDRIPDDESGVKIDAGNVVF
jgi:modification target Cys-rich repeat protein